MKYSEKIGFKVYNQETFVKAMQIINPNITILSEYINSSTPVKFLCECGEIHEKNPNSLLNGARCRKFIGSNKPNKKYEFLRKLNEINSQIKMIDDYIDANTRIKFKCVCGREFYKTPSQIIHSNPLCPKCANNRLTASEVIQKIKSISPDINIDLHKSNDFVKKHSKINCSCKCGNKWSTTIDCLLSGQGCSVCNRKRHTHEDFVQMVFDVNKDIKIISQYKTLDDNVTYKCKCGNIHTKVARLILRCPSCPQCADNTRKTTNKFIEEMANINPQIAIIGEYINAETPIEYICDCGKRHKSSPSILLQGHRCGHCNMSKPEKDFSDCLLKHDVEYQYEYKIGDCCHKSMLKFDFWLPTYQVLIEIDGEHHYKPVNFRGISDEQAKIRYEYCVEMDNIKNKYCKSNNITLIRIPYWNFTQEYYDKIITQICKADKKAKAKKVED